MSERHTSPLKLFEYMASGRPIVCADLPSLREVVSGKEVLFFEPNNADSLASSLANLLADTALVAHLATNARVRAESFTWEKRARHALAFLFD